MIDDKYLKDNYIYYADVGAKGGVNPKWINETKNFFSILFEPNPSSYEKLLENKKSNGNNYKFCIIRQKRKYFIKHL